MDLDQEAISAASAPLSDEPLQSAPANSASTQAAPQQPSQATAPASADPNAAPATAEPTAGENNADPDAQPQDGKPKFKGGFQKRIDELTRRSYDAERRALALEAQLQNTQQRAPAQDKPEPQIEQFQDINAFFKARDEWVEDRVLSKFETRQAEQQRQAQSQQQQDQQAVAALQQVERFKAAEDGTAEKYTDYHQVVGSPLMTQLRDQRPDITANVLGSDHGPEIAYFLGKNPQAAVALGRMDSFAAAREIGRIEQMFMSPKQQATNAPPPVRTVGNQAQAERTPQTMGNKEYREWRRQKGQSSRA